MVLCIPVYFQKCLCLSLTEANVGGTGKILKTGKIPVKTFQSVHKFNEKSKNAVLPLKHNSNNSVLNCVAETAAEGEHEGRACALLSDLLFVATPHAPLRHPLQRSRPVRWVGASIPTSKYS